MPRLDGVPIVPVWFWTFPNIKAGKIDIGRRGVLRLPVPFSIGASVQGIKAGVYITLVVKTCGIVAILQGVVQTARGLKSERVIPDI